MLQFLVIVVIAACGPIDARTAPPEPRYLHAALPGMPELLQVADVTGTVVGAALDPRTPPQGGPDETFLGRVDGHPNAVLVGWPGGCEQRADIAVDPPSEPGARPTFTLKLLPRADPCAAHLPRRVLVAFAGPVDPAGFNLDVVQ